MDEGFYAVVSAFAGVDAGVVGACAAGDLGRGAEDADAEDEAHEESADVGEVV